MPCSLDKDSSCGCRALDVIYCPVIVQAIPSVSASPICAWKQGINWSYPHTHKQGASPELWPSLLPIFPRRDSETPELGWNNSTPSPSVSKRAIRFPFPYVPCHDAPLTSAGGVQGRVSLAFPLASAVPGADALEQVPTVILLAPVVSNSVGSLGVVVIAAICVRNMTLSCACSGWFRWAVSSTQPPTLSSKLIL